MEEKNIKISKGKGSKKWGEEQEWWQARMKQKRRKLGGGAKKWE